MRAHYVRVPDLEELWRQSRDRSGGESKFVRKYGNFGVLVLDEWLLDKPDVEFRSMLLELMERRYDTNSTIFCTQFKKKDWHSRLGGGVHADAIMDRKCEASHLRSNAKSYVMRSSSSCRRLSWGSSAANFA